MCKGPTCHHHHLSLQVSLLQLHDNNCNDQRMEKCLFSENGEVLREHFVKMNGVTEKELVRKR